MNTQPKTNRGLSGKNSLGGKPLEINVLSSKGDIARFNELAGKFHYMGEGRPAGDTLRMAVVCEGEWVALFLWGSAAYRLKDRDEFIGWNNAQRAARQKLVVQNRRFVILSEPGANPNLASKVLGLAIRSLPALWRERFGYEPLLAETFCDIVGIVCLADHETGVPHAMTGSSQKEGAGDRCELKAGQKLVEAEDRLDNTIITADALHCQRDFVRSVVERGGEVLVQAKDNQKTVRANTEARLENTAPLLPGRKKGTVASTRAPSA
jgi:hypothetical protein